MNKSIFAFASLPFFISSLFGNVAGCGSSLKPADETSFFLTADFLYWKVEQEGLEYATLGITADRLPLTKGKVYKPHFQWEPGFKAGAGLNLAHDGWDLYANYTWIHSHAHISTGPAAPYPIDMLFFLAFNGLSSGSSIFNTKENWEFRFNNIDLELGRVIYLPKQFLLRPYFGLKGTWQDNDLHATINFSSIGTFRDHRKNDIWGIGLRGGLFSKWCFVKHFGIYGNFAASTLWFGSEASRKTTISIPNVPIISMHETDHKVLPVLEMGIGLTYDTGISNDQYHFSLSAGWELQDWINYNEILALVQLGSKGDLVMQGFTAEARFDF
jgi:hypothetical protein